MKNLTKQIGVTLLEVMLVLAVAAMIIVMSIRYYQAANANQQVNSLIQMAQGIAAAADSLSQKNGSYSNSTVTSTNIQALMPNNTMLTPWGSTVVFAPTSSHSYSVTFPNTPAAVCIQASARLSSNPKYTDVTPTASCGSTGNVTFSYSYDSQA